MPPIGHLGMGDPPTITEREGAGKPAQDALKRRSPSIQ